MAWLSSILSREIRWKGREEAMSWWKNKRVVDLFSRQRWKETQVKPSQVSDDQEIH